MPINFQNEYEIMNHSASFRDLRHMQDDKTVLENPHKGWYYHFIDNSLKSPRYRDNLTEVKRFKTPCMNHLYLRVDWGDIEYAGEGIFDFSEIDKIMDEWGALGYKFSFRFCTYEAGITRYATPKWVYDLGAKYTEIKFGIDENQRLVCEPVYDDPIFLEKLDAFLAECGRRYNNDDRVEYLDVGCFGTWGEGHTTSGSCGIYSAEVLKKYVNMHLKYFPDKTLIMNDDFVHQAYQCSPEDASAIYDYALNKGLGIRDDSICVSGYVQQFGFNTLRHPTIFRGFAENAPVDIEFCHTWHNIPERFKEGLPIIEALRTAHATYAGYHGTEESWFELTDYLTDYIANRLGYWYFIDGIDVGTPTAGATEMAKLYITNRGYSKCYHKYEMKLRLTDSQGKTYPLNSESPDLRRLGAESSTTETLRLDYRGVPAGEYTLELGIFFGERPIKLGMKEEMLTNDGYYALCEVKVAEI